MNDFHTWLDTGLLFTIAYHVGDLRARVKALEEWMHDFKEQRMEKKCQ